MTIAAALKVINDYADPSAQEWLDRMAEHFARWDANADDREDARIERRRQSEEFYNDNRR